MLIEIIKQVESNIRKGIYAVGGKVGAEECIAVGKNNGHKVCEYNKDYKQYGKQNCRTAALEACCGNALGGRGKQTADTIAELCHESAEATPVFTLALCIGKLVKTCAKVSLREIVLCIFLVFIRH